MQVLSLNFKLVVSRIEEEAMLLSVFFYCICAFLCAVAVSNYPFVVKAMSLVGFPPKNPFRHTRLFLSWQRGTIFLDAGIWSYLQVLFYSGLLRRTERKTRGILPFNQSFSVLLLLACGKSHSRSLISLSHSGLRKKRGYSLTRQRVIFLNRSVIK